MEIVDNQLYVRIFKPQDVKVELSISRMIMTICEQYQTMHGSVLIPDKLKKYMRNETEIKAKEQFIVSDNAKWRSMQKKITQLL